MKKQNELDKESIQIWCEQLSLCKPQPMSHKLCECFLKLSLMEKEDVTEDTDFTELIENDFIAALVSRRAEACHTYRLGKYATLFLAILCDRPGFAVQMLNYIQYKCWKYRMKDVDMTSLSIFFPFGFFSIQDMEKMWDKQKFLDQSGHALNMLDFPEYMESIKNIGT